MDVNVSYVLFSIRLIVHFTDTIKKHKFFYLPESAAAILFGTFIGLLLALFGSADVEKSFTFHPELFCMFMRHLIYIPSIFIVVLFLS